MSDATIIDVTFTDAETGEEFLRLKLPVRQLPKRDAPITLSKVDWLVVDSTPSRTEDIVKGGKVSLVLRKVQYVDPNTILFSLPTVADVIPEDLGEGDLSGALRLHEDDWLQLELIPQEALSRVEGELQAVRAVRSNERQGAGFKQLHVRKALPAPFEGKPLALVELRGLFGVEHPVAWRSGAKALKDCFAFTLTSGAWIYGQARNGFVTALGLTTRDDEAVGRLTGLRLIDWCAGEVYEAEHGRPLP